MRTPKVQQEPAQSIRGVFEGDLSATGTVVVEAEALVSARITADTVMVYGSVIGSISAVRVEVGPGGRVWGAVRSASLRVERGGFIRGTLLTAGPSGQSPHPTIPDLQAGHPSAAELERLLSAWGAHPEGASEAAGQPPIPQALAARQTFVRIVEAENQALRATREAAVRAQAAAEGLTAERDRLLGELERLQTHLAQSQREAQAGIEQLRAQSARAEQQAQAQQQQLRTLHAAALQQAQAELERLRAEGVAAQQRLQEALDRRTAEVNAAQDRAGALASDLQAAQQRIADVLASRDEAAAAAERLDLERTHLTAGLDLARSQQEAADEAARADHDRLVTAATSAQAEIAELRTELSGLQARHQSSAAELAAERDLLRAEIEQLRAGRAAAEQEAAAGLVALQAELGQQRGELLHERQRSADLAASQSLAAATAEQLTAERDQLLAELEQHRQG